MTLKFTVDSIDSIPEPQRGLYTKTEDGKFRLDVDGYEDPVGLKSALDKERKSARDAVALSKAWKELGKTPDEIQELLAAHERDAADKLTKAGEWDKLRAQMTEAHNSVLAKRDERDGKLTKQIERHLVDAAATAALAAASGNAELLLPHVKAKTKVIEEADGNFVVRVVDAGGNPRVDGKGDFLSITDLVSEMRQSDTFAPAFKAPPTSGGGAPNGGGPRPGGSKGKVDGTEQERADYFASKFNLQ